MILLTVVFLNGCSTNRDNGKLEFYLATQWNDNSEKLTTYDQPLFTDSDIKSYNWKTHEIIFKEEYLKKIDSKISNSKEDGNFIGGSRLLGTSSRDRFVMKINDEIIYTGYFHQSMLSSFYPVGIVIIDSENGIIISCNKLEADKRSDERVYKVLKNKKLLVN